MAKKSASPQSKAKTAYGLLSEVCGLIAEEPKRYDQGLFVVRKSDTDWTNYVSDMPKCGTVGCVAGWVATLKARKRFTYDDVSLIAANVLGIDHVGADELFSPSKVSGYGQSRQHAANGVAHIRKFQKKHAAQLKAKRV